MAIIGIILSIIAALPGIIKIVQDIIALIKSRQTTRAAQAMYMIRLKDAITAFRKTGHTTALHDLKAELEKA